MDPVLFDLGTGLRYFGQTQPVDEPFRGTCLLSHLHWDHIQGLPFFKPFLRPGAHVTIYAPVQPGDITVADVFADTIKPPLFPIHFSMFPGMVDLHEIGDDEFTIGDAKVMTRLIPHVGHTVGYRVEWNGRSVVYMSDHQMPADGSFSAWPGVLDLCAGADLLIHDAQYTPEEFETKRDWGHCTPEYAVWLAPRVRVQAPGAVPPRPGARRRRPRPDPRRGDRVRGEGRRRGVRRPRAHHRRRLKRCRRSPSSPRSCSASRSWSPAVRRSRPARPGPIRLAASERRRS